MKRIIKLFTAVDFICSHGICDKGFDDLNTSKTGVISLDPAFVLNQA